MSTSTEVFDVNPGGVPMEELQDVLSSILEAVAADDEIATVVRSQQIVEQFLRIFLTFKKISFKERAYFSTLARLAEDNDLPSQILNPAVKVNSIRNKLAHEFRTELSKDDIDDLVMSVNKLAELNPNYLSLVAQPNFGIEVKGVRTLFGSGNLRLDFALAATWLLKEWNLWFLSIGIGRAREQQGSTAP